MSVLASIVIPAFNNAKYLHATLETALSQTAGDYEVVIADHSSVDGTAEVIDRFADDPRLRILTPTTAGGGAQHNWNRVSQAAEGEFIKLLPGDDLLEPDALRKQLDIFVAHPTVTLCAGRRNLITSDGSPLMPSRGVPTSLKGLHPGAEAVRATVRAGSNLFGEPGCVLVRRDALENIGWWDGTNSYVIDERSYCRALLEDAANGRGDFFGLPENVGSFRVGDSQWSVRLANSQSDQVASFHDYLHASHPQVISAADRLVGNARARLMAWARRGVYAALRIKGC